MDNSGREESTVNQSGDQIANELADELSQTTEHVADDSGQPARSDAEFIEAIGQIWLSGGEFASHLAARYADHFVRAIGIGGEEPGDRVRQVPGIGIGGEEPGDRVRQVPGIMMQSGGAAARCAQAISAELVDLVLRSTGRSLDHLDAMMRSRTPQDFAAGQSEALRDQAEGVIEGTRRIAEITLRTADIVSRQVKTTMGRAGRAA